jgi:hypothetical protein
MRQKLPPLEQGRDMIRKLILPLAALVLLAGCVSTGYSYRSGNGDYYHGRPSVDYRYYPSYPYGYYGRYPGPYRYRYSSPWGYYGGYPYGYGHHHRYRYVYPRYPHHVERPRTDPTPDRPRSPWRDLDRLRDQDGSRDRAGDRDLRRNESTTVQAPRPVAPRVTAPAPRPAPQRTRSGDGDDDSSIGRMLRRTRDRSHKIPTP